MQKASFRPSTFAFVPPLLALALALRHGPALVDDAYITFRYAANLAHGQGLVYNPGQWVLGTTSPGLAGLLAAGMALGADIPKMALVLGLLSVAGLVHVIRLLAEELLTPWEALAVATVVALHPDLSFVANCGLETGPSMLAVYGAFALALRGRPGLAGLVGGLACLLRPDGVVVVALLALWALANTRAALARVLGASALPVLPWLIASKALYGSFLPHSVAAKQLIHPALPLQILHDDAVALFGSLALLLIGLLAVVGTGAMGPSRAPLLLLPGWLVAQVIGMATSGIAAVFPWYLSPLYPGLTLLAGLGLSALFGLRRRHDLTIPALGVLGLALLASTPLFRAEHEDVYFGDRVAAYERIGEILDPLVRPGDRVLLGEVGALGWALPEAVILDSSGINSPEISALRAADLAQHPGEGRPGEGTAGWVRAAVASERPRFIVSWHAWLHLDELTRDPAFTAQYRCIPLDGLDGYLALVRVGSAPEH